MRLDRFHLEHWLAEHEHTAERVIGTSGIASATLSDLGPVSIPELLDYGEIPGDAGLVADLAAWQGVDEEDVLVTVGGTEADFLVPFALVSPGDTVLVESPTYPVLTLVPIALGARVERIERRFEDDFAIDVDRVLERIVRGVKLVSFTNPNNPTGQLLDPTDLIAIAEACEDVGAFVMVDEIFRDLAFREVPVAHALHPRIVSTGSLTKCYGLSGLRCGWILAAPEERARFRDAKALTTVVNPAIDQHLARVAIARRDALLARAQEIAAANFARLEALIESRADALAWVRPEAAPLSAPRLVREDDDVAFARRLLAESGTLVAPGLHLDLPGHVRIGFGSEPAAFADGIARLEKFLEWK